MQAGWRRAETALVVLSCAVHSYVVVLQGRDVDVTLHRSTRRIAIQVSKHAVGFIVVLRYQSTSYTV